MPFTEIELGVEERVATITLNRPDRLNAYTPTMFKELLDAFDQTDADDDVRAVIVTGAGRGFCAGADLARGGDTFDGSGREIPEGSDVPRDSGGMLALRIFESTKPVIAAINGPAVGIGATMTLPMDIRVMSDEARMGFVFARRGIVPEACSTWFLPRIVGPSQAMEWIATGRVFDADEALAAGLVRSVHPGSGLLKIAQWLAHEMVENTAPVSVALSRQMVYAGMGFSHPMYAHRAESRALFHRGQSADVQEGVKSFLEKRAPAFSDSISAGLPEVFVERDEPPFR